MKDYIPNEATVTLAAKDFYKMVRRLDKLEQSLEEQENALEICIDQEATGGIADQVRILHHKNLPFAAEMALAVGNLLSNDSEVMDDIFKRGQYYYQPYYDRLQTYEWGGCFDLRQSSPLFKLAWEQAGKRKKELYDEHHPTSAELAYEEAIIEAEGRTI